MHREAREAGEVLLLLSPNRNSSNALMEMLESEELTPDVVRSNNEDGNRTPDHNFS